MNKKNILIGLGIVGLLTVFGGCSVISSFFEVQNEANKLDQNVKQEWSQVENVYQRRYDLIPNLVQTVQGAASMEKETFTAVAEARSKVGQVNVDLKNAAPSIQQLEQFQQAQNGLGQAMSRLMVVSEKYPDLKSNQNFLNLQTQLEGTENRIAVERRNFNKSTQDFNTYVNTQPRKMILSTIGGYSEKPYFHMDEAAANAPTVSFNFNGPKK